MKNPNRITFQTPPPSVRFETARPVTSPMQSVITIQSQQLCGQRCPRLDEAKGGICGRPCRGFAGHDLPHQCNQHHTW